MLHKRVVITTLPGFIHQLGDSPDSLFTAVKRGLRKFSFIKPETHFNPFDYDRRAIGEPLVSALSQTDAELVADIVPAAEKWQDRHQLLALAAVCGPMQQLQQDTGPYKFSMDRCGISFATGDGGLDSLSKSTAVLLSGKRLGPRDNLAQLPNVHAGIIARQYGLRGPSFVNCTACAASAHALIAAVNAIRCDMADLMLVGGTEAAITPYGIGSFHAQKALGDSLPFQSNRNGFVMAEGAAAFVVEELQHALNRDAPIYAEILGYGASSDANPELSLTQPDPKGGYRSFKAALDMAGLSPSRVDYLNAHGTGTPAGDAAEIEGVKLWAGDHLSKLMVSSTKGVTGHLLGAAAAFELGLCIMMLKEQIVIPTVGLDSETLDPLCSGPSHVLSTKKTKLDIIGSNSFGFGGTNASIIIGRYFR